MSELLAAMERARAAADTAVAARLIPYARYLGMGFEVCADGGLLFRLPYHPDHVGNPHGPALHGGVIGGFLETAAILQLLWYGEARCAPRVVDFSLDYLRSGRARELFGRCVVQRHGARVANVAMTAYQTGPAGDREVASARGHFLVMRSGT